MIATLAASVFVFTTLIGLAAGVIGAFFDAQMPDSVAREAEPQNAAREPVRANPAGSRSTVLNRVSSAAERGS